MAGKKILIIGFEKENYIKYPHLKDVVDFFQLNSGAEYLYFSQRGYFLGYLQGIKPNIIYALSILISIIDLLKFIFKNMKTKYSQIVVIDNFAYIATSIFSKKTILWSHDFVTNDQPHKKSFYQWIIFKGTSFFLKKNKKIIIQDIDRLKLFCESYHLNMSSLNVFYLPVSSRSIVREEFKRTLLVPKVLQIGGINQYRSCSHDLVLQYQKSSKKYELYLHGFFDKHSILFIKKQDQIPFCSTLELNASDVFKIVDKCDIGFIGYRSENLNFYYIAHASGQLVEFLKLGKPIIAYGATNMLDLVDKYKLGYSLQNINNLDYAIEYIALNYTELSSNCTKLFNDVYNFDNYSKKFNQWIFE